MRARLNVTLATPAPPGSPSGNRVTAVRWARALRSLGHRVRVVTRFTADRPCDLLVALHARKSIESVRAWKAACPERPLVVVLTGTDVYGDLDHDAAQESLSAAARIVTLQPLAADELAPALRGRVRPILQSARPARPPAAVEPGFAVSVLAHLRDVKDPFLAAEAARLLPASSDVRILHAGAALDPAMQARARAESEASARWRWLGPLPRQRALSLLAGSKLLLVTSRAEGGANVVTEALAAGVPVLSSRIAGSTGILGTEYPGLFPSGDAAALAALLARAESDRAFLATLAGWCAHLRPLADPEREREAWASLLEELSLPAGPAPRARVRIVPSSAPPAGAEELGRDVAAGLARPPRRLSCRHFYDDAGSALFEAICDLPEYYLFRAEREILQRHREAIVACCPPPTELVELGSGSAAKTRLLIETLLRRQGALRYVPIDLSPGALEESARGLAAAHPTLDVLAVEGEYAELPALLPERRTRSRLLLFLGSNVGNLDRPGAARLLARIASAMSADDRLLLGVDLRKDGATLQAAYDDAAGVTARFNTNLLVRIERELGGELDRDGFVHRAVYDEEEGCIRMYLVSRRRQRLRVPRIGLDVELAEGEAIHTEDSTKYSPAEIEALAAAAGLRIEARFLDSAGRFCDVLLRR